MAPPTTQPQAQPDDATNATILGGNTTNADESHAPETSKSAIGKVKKKGKAKLTPKEKEREESAYSVFFSHYPNEPLNGRCEDGDRSNHNIAAA
jgi:hypothetical protein